MKVTVGIPFLNSESTLIDSINSVVNQTHSDWELILMDDGSTDNSLEIANSYCDSRITVVSDGANKGLACRLNEISQLATGMYLARMDADDVMHPERLQLQTEFLQANDCIDVLGTSAYIIDDKNNITGIRKCRTIPADVNTVVRTGLFIHPSIMGKRDWFIRNPYDSNLRRSEDFDLWVRSFQLSRFDTLDLPLIFYRETNIVQSKKYIKTQLEKIRLLNSYSGKYISRKAALIEQSKTAIKIAIYFVLGALKKENILVNNRNKKLDQRTAHAILDALKSATESARGAE